MRLWSIHPQYLDAAGLVAVWREALLAQAVLQHKTRGYQHHPQVLRFRTTSHPVQSIGTYLYHLWLESQKRGYSFNASKIAQPLAKTQSLSVTRQQLRFEFNWLLEKLSQRNPYCYQALLGTRRVLPHPLFYPVAGKIEPWEKSSLK